MPTTAAALRWRSRPWLAGVVVVVGLALASLLADLTWDGEGRLLPAMWYLAAVVAVTLAFGAVAGLVVTGLSGALLVFLFVQPRWSFLVDRLRQLDGVIGFVVAGIAITLLIDRLQRARVTAEEATDERDRSIALFDSLLANAAVGLAFFDRELRFVRVNEALLAMTEQPVEAHLGRSIEEVLGDDVEEIAAALRQVRDTGEPVLDVALSGSRPGTGAGIEVVAGFYPVREPGGAVVGVGVVVRDVTLQTITETERELLFERVARIQAVTAGLAAAVTIDEVVDVVVAEGRRALDGVSASLVLLESDGETARLAGRDGFPLEVDERWQRFPVDSSHPFAQVIRTRTPVLATNLADLETRWPEWAAATGSHERRSLAVLPLVAEERMLGALGFGFADDRAFDAGIRTFLAAIAGLCAAALERARLFEGERRERDRAEAAGERLQFLAEASSILASSLDWEDTLKAVAELAVPRVADHCGIFLVEGGAVRPLVVAHSDSRRRLAVLDLVRRHPIRLDAAHGTGAVIRRGEPERWRSDEQLYAELAVDEEHLRLLRAIGGQVGITVPVADGKTTIGAIVIANGEGRAFTDEDLTMAEELGRRAAQAIVNARLFGERAHIAATLQESLLPRTTLSIPGVEVGTRFVAGGTSVDVGGDFYDVFPLGPTSTIVEGGEPERWAVVIGDVRGKGVEAAALTATARNALRSVAVLEGSPARMLAHLNEVLLRSAADGRGPDNAEPRFCTAAVAAIRPRAGGADVCIAVGGHPLPMLLRADGSTSHVGRPGTLLGVLPASDAVDVEMTLGHGDALVLYTDGLTERHDEARFFDEEALAGVLNRCTGFTAATVAERVETAARAFVEEDLRDDLALVVVRVPERRASTTSTAIDLPPEITSPRRARRFVATALETLGAPALVEVAELLTSEVVTNAVVHSGSTLRVNVESVDSSIRISVTDASPVRPQIRPQDRISERGRGMYLVSTLSHGWGVDTAGTGKCVWFELRP